MIGPIGKVTTAIVLTLGLSACGGGGGGGDGGVVTPPPPTARLEDGFGAGFATSYRNAPNTDPREPAPADIVAVSATTDPTPVP
ncbi:hypothetical protein [Phenylobacterium sp.]|uniref:hypothetical protein n=1 Tax=Phenylobacterium sp. TaxID=1871053 RepID=UPI00286AFC63|nr:hypothetical protein [Phenylobacterium sp.]